MSVRGCAWEESVTAAARKGEWDETLDHHVAGCSFCADIALVAGALLHDARHEVLTEPLPDPARIWLEARLRARRLQTARAMLPVTVVRWIAVAVAAGLATISLAWLEPYFGRWFSWLRPPAPDVVTGVAFLHGIVVVIASCAFVVFAGYALFTTRNES